MTENRFFDSIFRRGDKQKPFIPNKDLLNQNFNDTQRVLRMKWNGLIDAVQNNSESPLAQSIPVIFSEQDGKVERVQTDDEILGRSNIDPVRIGTKDRQVLFFGRLEAQTQQGMQYRLIVWKGQKDAKDESRRVFIVSDHPNIISVESLEDYLFNGGINGSYEGRENYQAPITNDQDEMMRMVIQTTDRSPKVVATPADTICTTLYRIQPTDLNLEDGDIMPPEQVLSDYLTANLLPPSAR